MSERDTIIHASVVKHGMFSSSFLMFVLFCLCLHIQILNTAVFSQEGFSFVFYPCSQHMPIVEVKENGLIFYLVNCPH